MARKKVEVFEKDLGETLVRLIVGVDTNPGTAPNVILYVRMEEEDKDSGAKIHEPQEIWLAKSEFMRLGILLILASSYFERKLQAGTKESEEEVKSLIARWKMAKGGMGKWLRAS